jgi:DNA-binding CsgD family transcriptional regulator
VARRRGRARRGAAGVAAVAAGDELGRGREAHAGGAWLEAFESLWRADEAAPLGAEDLERLATAAYMLGRDEGWQGGLERAHQLHLEAGNGLRALRCAFWLGVLLALQGEMGHASGWLGRAGRLLEREGGDCVERGYLLIPAVLQRERAGDHEGAHAAAAEAAAIGERFGDADLFCLAVHAQGNALVKQGRVAEGLGLLDEAMVAVVAGELSPIITGIIYCSVIDGCQEVHALRRAREWTAAMTRWCERQPDMVAFTGRCLVHRAEIMQHHGAWAEALEEAQRAGERCARVMNRAAAAQAHYREGEVHRLRGAFAAAAEAYREASRHGGESQPGLALLRLAMGNADAAAAAIRRAVGEAGELLQRLRLLPAHVEIMLAVGDAGEARSACRELEELAAGHEDGMLGAIVAGARGAVDLADGDAWAALVALRHAWRVWEELEVPYEAARARVLVGLACRALGDEEALALELEAARGAFERLGAGPDLARVEALARPAPAVEAHGLTARELEVLRLVASGQTNRAIAATLVLSERTVDRHVSNIFTKIGVSSRAAATAFAYEQRLI